MKVGLIGKNQGQSILEILLISFIVVTFLTLIYFVLNANLSLSQESYRYIKALNLANSELEKLQDLSKTNFNQIVSSSSTIDDFLIIRNITDIDAYTKKVEIKVQWLTNKEKNINLISYLTDWKNVPIDDGSGGATGGGGSGLSGDWKNPRTLSSIDLGPGNAGTDINVKFSTVFISSIASDEKKPDLFIIDVSNPQLPFIKSSINTGKGVISLSVKNNYAYLAHYADSQQLQVVDISNESNPILISSTTLPSNSKPLSIFAFKNYVAIGTQYNSSKPEVFIYDISNPGSPTLIKTLDVNINVNDIFVLQNRLYLGGEKFFIYDISDILNPNKIFEFLIANKTIFSLFPISYNYVLLGTQDILYFLNTSNLSNSQIVGQYNAGGKINDIYARENLAFLSTSNPNLEFQIVDYSNILNPQFYSGYNFPQEATGIDYRNNLIFVSVRSNDALRIITSR